MFGTAGRGHDKFIYDDAAFLLNMAMVDGALFGYSTFADVREQQIPDGQDVKGAANLLFLGLLSSSCCR